MVAAWFVVDLADIEQTRLLSRRHRSIDASTRWHMQVITISGRTIRKQAQASPEYAQAAIDVIEKLLAVCPPEDLAKAQEMRKARVKVA